MVEVDRTQTAGTNLNHPAYPHLEKSRYVIKNAALIDVVQGVVLRGAAVCIENGILSRRWDHSNVPLHRETIDAGGKYLIPGIIDAHVHLIWDGSSDPLATMRKDGPGVAMARGIANAWASLRHGVTTLRDLGSVGDVAVDIGRAFDLGVLFGPSVVAAGRMVQPTGGHVPEIGCIADTDEECIAAVHALKERGAACIKIASTGGAYGPEEIGPPLFSLETTRRIVEEARRLGLPVAAHCLGAAGTTTAVAGGVKTIEHGAGLTEESLRTMKTVGACLVPTVAVYRHLAESSRTLPELYVKKARTVVRWHEETVRAAMEIGVPIALGTDAGSPGFGPHPSVFLEMEALLDYGLSPLDILRAATVHAAKAIGLQDRVGVVEEGREADLLLLRENPLDDIRAMRSIETVIKRGVVL